MAIQIDNNGEDMVNFKDSITFSSYRLFDYANTIVWIYLIF